MKNQRTTQGSDIFFWTHEIGESRSGNSSYRLLWLEQYCQSVAVCFWYNDHSWLNCVRNMLWFVIIILIKHSPEYCRPLANHDQSLSTCYCWLFIINGPHYPLLFRHVPSMFVILNPYLLGQARSLMEPSLATTRWPQLPCRSPQRPCSLLAALHADVGSPWTPPWGLRAPSVPGGSCGCGSTHRCPSEDGWW